MFYVVIAWVVVSVSMSRSRDVPTSRLRLILRKNCQRLGLVSVSGGRRLGLGHLPLVSKTNFRPNCAGHSMQCERALDVVSLCSSYCCSSY